MRDPRLAPGARVRLTLHAAESRLPGPHVGTLQGVGGDSVRVLLADGTAPETLPWAAIARFEVERRDDMNPALRGGIVVLAAAAGVLGGYEIGRRTFATECPDNSLCIGEGVSDGLARLLVATLGGAVAGGVAVMATEPSGWQRVAIPRRVSVQPRARHGVTVAFTW